jgi:hypothetical protein
MTKKQTNSNENELDIDSITGNIHQTENSETTVHSSASKGNNIKYISIIILFFVPLFVFGAISVFGTDPTVSLREKRTLKTMPDLSLNELFFGDFNLKFEEYYSDTFPYRDALMAVNTELNRLYYITLPSSDNDVTLLIHKEDDIAMGGEALLPGTDSEEAFSETSGNDSEVKIEPDADGSDYTEPDNTNDSSVPSSPSPSGQNSETKTSDEDIEIENTPFEPLPELEAPDAADLRTGSIIIVGDRAMEIANANEQIMKTYAETVNLYGEKMPESRIICLVTPNAGEFYSPKEFHSGTHSQKQMIEATYAYMNESIVTVDAYSEIRKHTDEYIFFRTDHHWTQRGAYYAYVAFCKSLDLEPFSLDEFETGTIEGFVGSMYSFTANYPQSSVLKENPDTVHYYRPIRNFKSRIYTDARMDESTAYNGYVIASKVSNNNKYLAFISGDTPLMHIRTDVGNGKKIAVIKESYGNAFVPFLVNHYEEIFVIDPRKYSGDGTPDLYLPSFVDEYSIDDVLIIDYPLVVSSQRYVGILQNIIR